MKLLLGVRGNHSLLLKGKALRQKTEYKMRNLVEGTIGYKLDILRKSINTEITIAAPYLLTLEDLATRYHEDGVDALRDKEFGYYQRYVEGYEQTQRIVTHCYRSLPSPF